jgi:hypothetical protein
LNHEVHEEHEELFLISSCSSRTSWFIIIFILTLFYFDNLAQLVLTILIGRGGSIIAAFSADAVGLFHLLAFRAGKHKWRRYRVVRAAFPTPRLRVASFWIWHY